MNRRRRSVRKNTALASARSWLAAVHSKSQALWTHTQTTAQTLFALAALNLRWVLYGITLVIVVVAGLLAVKGTLPIPWLAGIAAVGMGTLRASAPRAPRRG
jgi:hypothetical protein